MVSDDLLPDSAGDSRASGLPTRSLLLLGTITAAFGAYGSLNAITSFASIAFISVFGGMSYLAFSHRDHEAINPVPPAVGVVGCGGFQPVMLYHLYQAERTTFYIVLLLAIAAVTVELLYFERTLIEEEITDIEEDLIQTEDTLEEAIDPTDVSEDK